MFNENKLKLPDYCSLFTEGTKANWISWAAVSHLLQSESSLPNNAWIFSVKAKTIYQALKFTSQITETILSH